VGIVVFNFKDVSMLTSPTTGYLVSGVTFVGGATATGQQVQGVIPIQHVYFGFPLSEIALLVGIVGTAMTVLFQYLNYKNNKRK
jgi:hypothetical protein